MCEEKVVKVESIDDFDYIEMDVNKVKSMNLTPVKPSILFNLCDMNFVENLDCLIVSTPLNPEGLCIKRRSCFNNDTFLHIYIKADEKLVVSDEICKELIHDSLYLDVVDSDNFAIHAFLNNIKLDNEEKENKDVSFQVSESYDDNILKREIVYENGEKEVSWLEVNPDDKDDVCYLIREDGEPNRICYYSNGNIKSEQWLDCDDTDEDEVVYGLRQRDLPNYVRYYENGNVKCEEWIGEYEESNLRSDDLPSKITWYESGGIKCAEWIEGFYHVDRPDDQPNYIEYYDHGHIKSERWLEEDRNSFLPNDPDSMRYKCRTNGLPNCIEYTSDGKYEKWLLVDEVYINRGPLTPNEIYRAQNGSVKKFVNDKGCKKIIITR